MKRNTDLKERMNAYEDVYNTRIPDNIPMLLRIDGKNFSTFTRKLVKPFDNILAFAMENTLKNLCQNIANCQFGYTQSDEMTLVVFKEGIVSTNPYFDKTPIEIVDKAASHNNRLEKIVSLDAGEATRLFNHYFRIATHIAFKKEYGFDKKDSIFYNELSQEEKDLLDTVDTSDWNFKDDISIYQSNFDMAKFDCKVWVMPPFEIVNSILYRQQDGIRNSIEGFARTVLSQTEMYKKNNDELKVLCANKNNDWNNLDIWKQRGLCAYKVTKQFERDGIPFTRKKWEIDKEMPLIAENKSWIYQKMGVI